MSWDCFDILKNKSFNPWYKKEKIDIKEKKLFNLEEKWHKIPQHILQMKKAKSHFEIFSIIWQ